MDEEMKALQRDYLADVKQKLTIIRQHAEALPDRRRFVTSFPVLLHIAHQLKGSGGSLGFPTISDAARTLSERLNEFLDDEVSPRPSPQELSSSVMAMAAQLDEIVRQAEKLT